MPRNLDEIVRLWIRLLVSGSNLFSNLLCPARHEPRCSPEMRWPVSWGGSFKEIELSRLSWTRSPQGRCTQPANSQLISQNSMKYLGLARLAELSGVWLSFWLKLTHLEEAVAKSQSLAVHCTLYVHPRPCPLCWMWLHLLPLPSTCIGKLYLIKREKKE